jgi:hypothetical protein
VVSGAPTVAAMGSSSMIIIGSALIEILALLALCTKVSLLWT